MQQNAGCVFVGVEEFPSFTAGKNPIVFLVHLYDRGGHLNQGHSAKRMPNLLGIGIYIFTVDVPDHGFEYPKSIE